MTLKVKKDGAWKEASSLKVKINGEWKDISTLYSKKDGAWVTVYSSGALITFSNYPYPIPVAKGWKYSTDKVNWTTVSSDSTINESGTFTGFIKANSITLNEYSTKYTAAVYQKKSGTSLQSKRNGPVSFVNGSKGYVCSGASTSGINHIDVYDESGTRTTGVGTGHSAYLGTAFVLNSKGYLCGGTSDDSSNANNTIDIYDTSGIRTSGPSMSANRRTATSFVNGSKGYICGGATSNKITTANNNVDVIDSSGNLTTGMNLSTQRTRAVSFTLGSNGYVCGGHNTVTSVSSVDVYDQNGNRSQGTALSTGRSDMDSFVNGNYGYICGGYIKATLVEVYNKSGVRTTGTALSVGRWRTTSFVINSKGYVCGGYDGYEDDDDSYTEVFYNTVDIYKSTNVRTTGTSLSSKRCQCTSFALNNIGFVCGGRTGFTTSNYVSTVERYYDQPEIVYTKLPITEGSTYTLNGESGTADVSKVMEFDSKVSGTIKYKEGDMSPGVKITVVDESGNVVEGATISIEKLINDWNLDNIIVDETLS